jgi:hypothetical protein
MLWNEFIKLNHISKLSLNEQLRKFNEHVMYEEQVAGSIRNIIRIPVTIIIRNLDADNIAWYKNGVLQNTFTDNIDHTFTINAGDTFFAQGTRTPTGAFLYYLVNGVLVADYFGNPTATSATFTAVGGNTYRFESSNPG